MDRTASRTRYALGSTSGNLGMDRSGEDLEDLMISKIR